MSRHFLQRLSTVSFILGLILGAPGILLLLASAQIMSASVKRDLEAR